MATTSPVKGSTAPAITSSLMAWPAKPIERSPLSTPATNTFENLPEMPNPRPNAKGKEPEKAYGPPKRPLTPNQLGRIAQSFGIVIPSLPASTSPVSAGPSRRTIQAVSSPYLLTIIPPISLLQSADPDKSRQWRRGRLLPLQPSIGSMLLLIAREFGLPSTAGLNLYLVTADPSSSTSSTSDDGGPLISPSTWSTLFSSYLRTRSQCSTPIHTPPKAHGSLARDMTFPPSPLSLIEKRQRLHSFNTVTDASKSAVSSSSLAPTPSVVGTIEFEVDPENAPWLAEWKRSGGTRRHRRKISSISDSGISGGPRELRLKAKSPDSADTTLVADDIPNFKVSLAPTEITPVSAPNHNLLTPRIEEDFLASPIELDKAQLDQIRTELMDKRGSSLMMAEELDDLERIMRQLSPREIRLTSPRELTPRMAAKVATANLTLPAPKPSPLASEPVMPESRSEPKGTWPAVPFGSPHSPNIDDIFRQSSPRPEAEADVSAETLKRMQNSPPRPAVTEWRPPRPPRPKSPRLEEHSRTLSHTLSPEMVNQLRSPPPVAISPDVPDPKKMRGRAASVSIRGLKHQMSAKNLNLKWGNEAKPELPKETVGLFKGATEGTPSSFASLKQSTEEESRPGLASRFFSFGRKASVSKAPRSVSDSKVSRRNLSHDGPIISPPIAASFQKMGPADMTPDKTRRGSEANKVPYISPSSPASPHSVRRKPVPGFDEYSGDLERRMSGDRMMRESESMASMGSFVLEDPPRRRKGAGGEYR